jgi:hypothetical protein
MSLHVFIRHLKILHVLQVASERQGGSSDFIKDNLNDMDGQGCR